jgi:hypothetical protein
VHDLAAVQHVVDAQAAVDHHAHLLADQATPRDLSQLLTESTAPTQIAQVRQHPSYHRALRDLAGLLGIEADERALSEVRARDGPARFVRRLVEACGLEAMLVDDGFRYPGALSLDDHAALVGCPVRRIVRIETTAEDAAAGWPAFDEMRARFSGAVTDAVERGAVSLKTIAAYRCGLDLPTPDPTDARTAYEQWRSSGSPRLIDARLVSYFVGEAMDLTDQLLPLQVHTGIGDRDLSLAQADPSLLRPLLEDRRRAGRPVVLLHCYPFVRQASWLASIYPDVYVDLSLAITLVAHRGTQLVLEALDLAPATKLLFGTDASRLPEMWYLGARWWRDALAGALARFVEDQLIDRETAAEWAALILAGNARRLYFREPSARSSRASTSRAPRRGRAAPTRAGCSIPSE